MDTINDEEVLIIKKKRAPRKPKSENTRNPQQIENTEMQDPETQVEPSIKAKPTSRAKKSKSDQTITEPSQDEPKPKVKAVKPRMKKSQPNQTKTQNGEEEAQQQPKKIVDTIVVDI